MRIRQVKPAFWSDETTAAMIDPTDLGLFYIGLWMQADDAGYLRWEPRRIAAELYPYTDTTIREAAVLHHKVALEESKRLRVYKCGHAFIPNLTSHQRLAGATHQVLTEQREHAKCSTRPRLPAVPRDSPRRLGQVRSGIGNGQVRSGNAREDKESDNGVTTIEEHDAAISRRLSEEEQAAVWMDLYRKQPPGSKAAGKAEAELIAMGYRLEGKDWVR